MDSMARRTAPRGLLLAVVLQAILALLAAALRLQQQTSYMRGQAHFAYEDRSLLALGLVLVVLPIVATVVLALIPPLSARWWDDNRVRGVLAIGASAMTALTTYLFAIGGQDSPYGPAVVAAAGSIVAGVGAIIIEARAARRGSTTSVGSVAEPQAS
jgi:hypothetical protein